MTAPEPTEVLAFADAGAWEAWLAEHHGSATDVWLRIARRHAAATGLVIGDALDVALCFGWIDSHRRAGGPDHYLQRYSPRRPASPWSQVNVEKAEALVADGRMRPAGLAAIDAAVADGRWAAAYERQATAEPPADLVAALAEHPAAQVAFDGLDRSARYATYLPILKARSPRARATQVDRAVAALAPPTAPGSSDPHPR